MTDVEWIDTKDTGETFFNPAHVGFEFKESALNVLHPQKPLITSANALSVDNSFLWGEATSKPTIEEELSKIHEELANLRQSNNELEHEGWFKDGLIKKQNKEITKLKQKLRKEQAKTRNIIQTDQMQKEIDELQDRVNELQANYDVKSEYK